MALPNKVYDDEDDKQSLSARERADQRWGMSSAPKESDDIQDSEEGVSEGSALDKARERWGEADVAGENEQKSDRKGGGEDPKEPEDTSFTYNPEGSKIGMRARLSGMSNSRKWAVFGGAGLLFSLVGGFIALISLLMPFKATHIISQIEQRLGEVPQHAIERRLEYYMNRYLILRTLAASVGDENINRNNYVYLGDGVFGTLYTNWRGANLEAKLAAQGWRLEPAQGDAAQIFNRRSVKPTEWNLVNDSAPANLRSQNLNSRQARSFIKEFAKSETDSIQVLKRYNMRKMLRKYYGINNWRFFEEERDGIRRSYLEKKLALKKRLVQATVSPVSSRYGLYLNCLLEGGDNCREQLGRGGTADVAPDSQARTDVDPETGEEITIGGDGGASTDRNGLSGLADEAAELIPESGAIDRTVARQIAEQIQKLGVKKILASFAAGIGLLDTVAQIVNSVNSGALNIIVYDKNAQQYANFAAPLLSMADQIRSGDITSDDARFLNEIFNNYQTSPVYKAEFGSKSGTVSAQASTGERIRRDCNNDGDTSDDGELLEAGETVCPAKRLVQDKTSFTDNELWGVLSSIIDKYNSFFGGIVRGFTNLVSSITNAIGLDSITNAIMDALGINEILAKAFEFLLNRIAGPVVTGSEVEEDAYDALYAGMTVNYSSIGGGVGTLREDTIGGQYLSESDVLAIRNEEVENRQYAKARQSIAERYLSTDNLESLASNTLVSIPTSLQELSSLLTALPSNLFGNLGSLLTSSVGAQQISSSNPFHALWYGYPTNHPIFTANDGEGMDEAQLEAQYKCSLPVSERPQNQDSTYTRPDNLPFDVSTQADPCLLEQIVLDVGSRSFTNTFDTVTGGGQSNTGTGNDTVNCNSASGNQKIVCAALQYTGVRYANRNAGTGNQWLKEWGVSSITGSLGQYPKEWLEQRVVGGSNDFLECSGYTNLSIYVAFGVEIGPTCSAGYYNRLDYFRRISPEEARPGDFLIKSQECGNDGHIGIFVERSGNSVKTLESSAGRNDLGEKKTGYYTRPTNYYPYAVRYIGPGSTP